MKTSLHSRLTALVQSLQTVQSILIEAAGKTQSTQIANACYQLANDHSRFAAALASFDDAIAADRYNFVQCSVSRVMQRLRSALSHGDAYSLLGELVRCETDLLDQFKQTLAYAAGTEFETLLKAQCDAVAAALERLRSMRDNQSSAVTTCSIEMLSERILLRRLPRVIPRRSAAFD